MPTQARLRVNNVTLGFSGDPSHMSCRTQYTHSERNTANVVRYLDTETLMANTANTPSNGTGSQKPRPPNNAAKHRLTRQSCQLHGQITVHYDKHATPGFTTYTTSVALSPYPPYILINVKKLVSLKHGVRAINQT